MSQLNPFDFCPRRETAPSLGPTPHTPPTHLSSVWECESPTQADAILGGESAGYVYARDGNPNSTELADACRALHGADHAIATASGMAALAAAMLAKLRAGDHVVLPAQLYGRTTRLFQHDGARFGISTTIADNPTVAAIESACGPKTRMIVVETIANPRLEVADIAGLAKLARRIGALLLVDNTFAGPGMFRPLAHGAHLVVESLTKLMNGHSDVILGLLAGEDASWADVSATVSTFGMSASAFDSWLARRGLMSYAVRQRFACANAQAVAEFLSTRAEVRAVDYPGLPSHADHALAKRQFGEQFGTIVTFHLAGGRAAADRFIAAAKRIPFCPSLGEASTTVSHPDTTSHRGFPAEQRTRLGIEGGTMRLSVGIESFDFIREGLVEGLDAPLSHAKR